MSEFLQDLLKKVKKSADDLDAPLDEPDSKNDGSFVSSRQKKIAKPGLPIKPGLATPSESESGLPSEPGLVGESGLSLEAGLSDEPGLPIKPGLATPDESEPGSPSKPGLMPESGLSAESGFSPKPGLPFKSGLVTPDESEPGSPSKPGLMPESASVQLLKTLVDSRHAINTIIPSMKDSELRLYSYLVEQTYGNQRTASDGVVPYSQKEAMRATGIKSTATIVKSMNSLSKKKLIKWVRKSRKRGEASQIRVFLPRDTLESSGHSDPLASE
jgi:hypothetical protein